MALPAADAALALGAYRDRWRRVVLALKRGDAALAAAAAAALARALGADLEVVGPGRPGASGGPKGRGAPPGGRRDVPRSPPDATGWTVTWVPSPPERLLARGFVPPERVARALAAQLDLAARPLLRARIGAPRQTGLDRAARRRNARTTFRAAREVSGGVILVDDVITTGATAEACAAALRGAGARRVLVVAVARTGTSAPPPRAAVSAPRRSAP